MIIIYPSPSTIFYVLLYFAYHRHGCLLGSPMLGAPVSLRSCPKLFELLLFLF